MDEYGRICAPTLVVDTAKVRANVGRMAERARRNGAALRPHLKTHQSATIGRIFREAGVSAGTVSSAGMAAYFADSGWDDLTIAFPVNLRELPAYDALASRVRLGLLVDHPDAVAALASGLTNPVEVWIKVDVGSRRCGIKADQVDAVAALATAISTAGATKVRGGRPLLSLAGLLTHDSRSYAAYGAAEVGALYREGTGAVLKLRDALAARGFQGLKVSVGDTPSASLLEDWLGVDEARPGNFAYYDLQQLGTGACSPEEVAVAVACPVVGIYPERGEAVVYGGAVHLSKQAQPPSAGRFPGASAETSYGGAWRMAGPRWDGLVPGAYLRGLTQEHGIVRLPADELARLRLGDLLFVCPVHSCLAAHALRDSTIYL